MLLRLRVQDMVNDGYKEWDVGEEKKGQGERICFLF